MDLMCRPERPVPSLLALQKEQAVLDCYMKNKDRVLDCYQEVESFKQVSREALKVIVY